MQLAQLNHNLESRYVGNNTLNDALMQAVSFCQLRFAVSAVMSSAKLKRFGVS